MNCIGFDVSHHNSRPAEFLGLFTNFYILLLVFHNCVISDLQSCPSHPKIFSLVLQNLHNYCFQIECADVFVFSVDNAAEAVVTTSCAEKLQNVYFLPLDEFWVTPPEAGPEASWEGPGKGSSYRCSPS